MLPSTDDLSRLLGTLYDAACESALWDGFLQQLGQMSRSHSAAMALLDFRENIHTLSRSWKADPEALSLYGEYYGSIDIWGKRGASRPAGHVCTSQSLCPIGELRTTEVYNDFMMAYLFEHGMFSVLEGAGPRVASISLCRDSSPEFGESDLQVLRFLAPHLQRAFRLHFQFSELKALRDDFGAALDVMPAGVVLLSSKGEIVRMNREAAKLISGNDGLFATRNALCAERSTEAARLERLISEAANTSIGKGLGPAGALSVSRKKGLPLHVLITPVGKLKVEGPVRVCAIAFIHDLSHPAKPMPEMLRDLFGLTPAESRVSLLLAEGRQPKEIAETLGITAHTMKSHLSSLYGKTSTSGQVQLVRLLTQLSLNVSPEGLARS